MQKFDIGTYTDAKGTKWDLLYLIEGKDECKAFKKMYGKAFVSATTKGRKSCTDLHVTVRLVDNNTGKEVEGLLRINNQDHRIMAYEEVNKYATEK